MLQAGMPAGLGHCGESSDTVPHVAPLLLSRLPCASKGSSASCTRNLDFPTAGDSTCSSLHKGHCKLGSWACRICSVG